MKLPAAVRPLLMSGLLLPAAAMLSTGCATAASAGTTSRDIAAGSSFTMHAGERVTLPGEVGLHYVEVIADSRCPPDVRCVWAGDAEVAFTSARAGAAPQSFTLHTGRGDRSRDIDGLRLTLVSLARGKQPQAELRIDRTP